MTERSEVDPAVLAGEPDSVHQLEGGDDDLPLVGGAEPDAQPLVGGAEPDEQERAADKQEWAGLDRIVDANPTALGE